MLGDVHSDTLSFRIQMKIVLQICIRYEFSIQEFTSSLVTNVRIACLALKAPFREILPIP